MEAMLRKGPGPVSERKKSERYLDPVDFALRVQEKKNVS